MTWPKLTRMIALLFFLQKLSHFLVVINVYACVLHCIYLGLLVLFNVVLVNVLGLWSYLNESFLLVIKSERKAVSAV